MTQHIKWAAIQPLTGGFYLGAEEAIGCPADFILSFPGFADIKRDKNTGEMTSVANEYHLINYLQKHDRMPDYRVFDREAFNPDMNTKVNILETQFSKGDGPNFDNLDLVIALPVCSGISMATSGTAQNKDMKNCNMKWIASYVLNEMKPRAYVFENAPTLMGSRGNELRIFFNQLGKKTGYSVLYYKTDTQLHDNCQMRPRTFVIFFKHKGNNENEAPPKFEFCDQKIKPKEFFERIPKGLTQMDTVNTAVHNYILIDYIKEVYGENWADQFQGALITSIIKQGKLDEFIGYVENIIPGKYTQEDIDKSLKYLRHIKYKLSLGKNYYGSDICLSKEVFPSVQFRSIPNMLHPSATRTCTVREFLELMGMPHDFELLGDSGNLPKIGQNVPVKTAKFIIANTLRCLNEDREINNEFNIFYQDNISKRETIVA